MLNFNRSLAGYGSNKFQKDLGGVFIGQPGLPDLDVKAGDIVDLHGQAEVVDVHAIGWAIIFIEKDEGYLTKNFFIQRHTEVQATLFGLSRPRHPLQRRQRRQRPQSLQHVPDGAQPLCHERHLGQDGLIVLLLGKDAGEHPAQEVDVGLALLEHAQPLQDLVHDAELGQAEARDGLHVVGGNGEFDAGGRGHGLALLLLGDVDGIADDHLARVELA